MSDDSSDIVDWGHFEKNRADLGPVPLRLTFRGSRNPFDDPNKGKVGGR